MRSAVWAFVASAVFTTLSAAADLKPAAIDVESLDWAGQEINAFSHANRNQWTHDVRCVGDVQAE